MEVKICKFHYHGHCKFGPNCRNLYTPETCVTTFWDWLTCPSRHPKPCKYHIQFDNCLFGSSCSYLHVAKENEIEALKKDLTNILALVNAKEKEIQVTMLAPAPVCAPGVATGQPTKGHPGPYGERWQVQFAPSEALLFNNDHTKITKPPPLHCTVWRQRRWWVQWWKRLPMWELWGYWVIRIAFLPWHKHFHRHLHQMWWPLQELLIDSNSWYVCVP